MGGFTTKIWRGANFITPLIEKMVPEFLRFHSCLSSPFLSDDAPHYWKASPRVEAARDEAEFLVLRYTPGR